jgi:hypothetical protein
MKSAMGHPTRRRFLKVLLAAKVALIAVKQERRLEWNPKVERFVNDEAANTMLQSRTFRGGWRLKEV